MKKNMLRLRGYAYTILIAVYIIAIWFTVLVVMGCSKRVTDVIQEPVLTAPASPQQCANGGTAVTLGTTSYLACNGLTGSVGAIGAAGPQGEQGATGPAGEAGTQVTVVQFCPGVTSTYPSNFPEVGFCISNQLYAVYSANDGFLTLVTPGVYSSDGINASCTFTVAANCEVTQ
jgi:hypothetical protein